MIHELRTLTPYIDFGLGKTTLQAVAGQPVTVWLATLYNTGTYSFTLSAAGSDEVVEVSGSEYRVTYNTPGNYALSLEAISRDIKTPLQSNILNLTIL